MPVQTMAPFDADAMEFEMRRRAWIEYEEKRNSKCRHRRSLMQRLSSWFEDHLPLRRRTDGVRRSERGSRRKASKSAAPRMRYSVANAQKQNELRFPLAGTGPHHAMSVSMIGHDSIFDDGYTEHNNHRVAPPPHTRPDCLDDMCVSMVSQPAHARTPFPTGSLSQSFTSSMYSSCRGPRVRTNPWVRERERSSVRHGTAALFRSPQPPPIASRSMYSAPAALSKAPDSALNLKARELLYSSMDRTAQLRVKSLDESTCSSGYGSQDSSPESSVHSPDWQQAAQQKRVEDKAVECRSIELDAATGRFQLDSMLDDDEHVYHELESLQRLSLLLEDPMCSSSSAAPSPQPTTELHPCDSSRTSSPIYAVPYDSQRSSVCSENPFSLQMGPGTKTNMGAYARVQPLSIESPFFRRPSPVGYAVPERRMGRAAPPQWHCPPPPPLDHTPTHDVDILAELDKQIAELQLQSDAVRQLVEQAKERSELRERTRLLCLEHIHELRKMRWYMRNNFELCL